MMLFQLKQFISIFSIAVFLFPLVAEEVHTFEHRNDSHCTERSTTHFHEMEHHCSMCDFVHLTSDTPFRNKQILEIEIYKVLCFNYYLLFEVAKHNCTFLLRGPPTIS